MSSKSTIFLTQKDEHCFFDSSDNTINLEILPNTAKVEADDNDYHFIEFVDENSEIYQLFRLIEFNPVMREEIKKHIPNFL